MSETSSLEARLSEEAKLLLARIKSQYLESREFNGLIVKGSDVDLKSPASELLKARLIQVVSDKDWMNPHIRPWPSKRSLEDQLLDIEELTEDDQYGFCLYPTNLAMADEKLPEKFEGKPFHIAMARGKGALEVVYFEFEVLEGYRNDSRFELNFGDTGASIYVNSSEEHSELEDRMIYFEHIGYGYDLTEYDPEDHDSPIIRRVAIFYCDLINLDSGYQRRWESYQVSSEGVIPHPAWWSSQMGKWTHSMGPFERLFVEMSNINELCTIAFGDALFRSSERPEDLGWILRPSQREWDDFVHQMDKVLSDNLSTDFLNSAGVPKKNAKGQQLGTMNRLQLFLESGGVSEDHARIVLEPMRDIRSQRQVPAHAIRANMTDKTFVHKQISLLHDVNMSMAFIAFWLSRHPACVDWEDQWGKYGDWIF